MKPKTEASKTYLCQESKLKALGWPRNLISDVNITLGGKRVSAAYPLPEDIEDTLQELLTKILRSIDIELVATLYASCMSASEVGDRLNIGVRTVRQRRLHSLKEISRFAYLLEVGNAEYRRQLNEWIVRNKVFASIKACKGEMLLGTLDLPNYLLAGLREHRIYTLQDMKTSFSPWMLDSIVSLRPEDRRCLMVLYTELQTSSKHSSDTSTFPRTISSRAQWVDVFMSGVTGRNVQVSADPEEFEATAAQFLDEDEFYVLMDLYKHMLSLKQVTENRFYSCPGLKYIRDRMVKKVRKCSEILIFGQKKYLEMTLDAEGKSDVRTLLRAYKRINGSLSIGCLPLSDPSEDLLLNYGINDVSDLVNFKESELYQFHGIGAVMVAEVKQALLLYGLTLCPDSAA